MLTGTNDNSPTIISPIGIGVLEDDEKYSNKLPIIISPVIAANNAYFSFRTCGALDFVGK